MDWETCTVHNVPANKYMCVYMHILYTTCFSHFGLIRLINNYQWTLIPANYTLCTCVTHLYYAFNPCTVYASLTLLTFAAPCGKGWNSYYLCLRCQTRNLFRQLHCWCHVMTLLTSVPLRNSADTKIPLTETHNYVSIISAAGWWG